MVVIGYVGEPIGFRLNKLTTWKGTQLGTCRLASSWRVRSYIGSRMYQIYATIEGKQYTGRGFGYGMAVKLRPVALKERVGK